MPLPLAEFDELHVISDLHLGGRPGFQIFGSTNELVWLIVDLHQRPSACRVALVINGDFIDFLAQAPALPFDPEGAVDKLAAIANEPAFMPVFNALREFTATDNRQLIVNLGNHDLEFVLPWVREALINVLSGGNPAARGRITLALDGAGVLMRVGGARVLCVHGNEVDPWNVADYEHIRRIGRDLMQGRGVEPWVPNGGSQLVSEVMNPLKRDYPFIDLLKPEMPAVFPTLIALRPSVVAQLGRLAAAVARRSWDAARIATGFLEEASPETGVIVPTPALGNVGGNGLRALRRRREEMARDLLDSTETSWREDAVPLDLVGGYQRAEYVGVIGALKQLVTGKGPIEALREALNGLDNDRSFDPSTEDDTYRGLDKLAGGDIDFLIAGHTHLERALKRRRGRGYYFNSGTWARLIQLPPQLRQDAEAFAKAFERMKAGTIGALDGGPTEPGLTLRRCSVVSIWHEGGATIAELRRVTAHPGPSPAFAANPVPGTRLSVT
jgi:UDP-2,3-diacylglucosamine pyrophosphatase LpxH